LPGNEVLCSHIEALRLQVGADFILAVSESLHAINNIAAGDSDFEGELPTDEATVSTGDFYVDKSGQFEFSSDNKHTLWISSSMTSNDPSDTFDNAIAPAQETSFIERKSVSKHNQSNTYRLCFYFKGRVPGWVLNLKHSNTKSRLSEQQSVFLRLLHTGNLILQMVSDHQKLVSDPLTKLNARTQLLQKINQLSDEHTVVLCLVHCCEFQQINKKQGNLIGDTLLGEIASQITSCTRDGDTISRLGGALFAVACATNSVKEAEVLGNKVQQYLQQQPYLIEHSSDGMPTKLNFKVGVAVVEFDEPSNADIDKATVIMNRAEQALQAAQSSDNTSVIAWQAAKFSINAEQFNYLGGIFTSDTMTNYRNMLLLWDISSIIADEFDFEKLVQNVVQRLANTFDFNIAGLWRAPIKDQKVNSLCFEVDDSANAVLVDPKKISANSTLEQQISLAVDTKKQQDLVYLEDNYWVLPLEVNTDDCFFIIGEPSRFILTHDTKVLIQGFVRQIGKALRRSQLEEELSKRLESQNERLENELKELKGGLASSALVYKSPVMQSIMKQTQRAASADTTVLITGESGTGKEKLINAIHTLGPRSEKPLIIVDCGSIPETLIESELFGYIKGAFTGAQKAATGKIQEADGGILVLDEIGELPLQMQPKLLRFVQEKHFTPVGGTKVINVNVKIVAVTNRDLSLEVERGRFRKDLYYRLNVVTLNNPPLRERGDDMSLLAQHFLNKFSKQFDTEKKYLSNETLRKMQAYSWPGNVRELENKLMQATLLSENDEITLEELNLEHETNSFDDNQIIENVPYTNESTVSNFHANTHNSSTASQTKEQVKSVPTEEGSAVESISSSASSNSNSNSNSDSDSDSDSDSNLSTVVHFDSNNKANQQANNINTFFTNLQASALAFLTEIRLQPAFMHCSLGNMVEDELLVMTYQSCDGNMRDLATRMQLPTSTARRRVNKILLNLHSQPNEKPGTWENLRLCMQPVASGEILVPDCLDSIKQVLLAAIMESEPENMSKAAALLGVSEPTFYKLKKSLIASA
jgi:diguanylate cyclase (GGDEF)-like protein